jgi:cell wall-associated NlpC family hydrolase
LKDTAARFAQGAREAGLAPPSRFGTEVVARLLGLRLNHPAKDDVLERLPGDPAPRSEAAYSAAQILRFGGWELDGVRAAAEEFTIPALGAWQRRVLTTAFKLVGYPYIWGGTSDFAQFAFGVTVPGGYDCSGFVWRVFKLQAYAGGAKLSPTLRGRTTFAMSAEVPKAQRIPLAGLQPADVIFFGDKGQSSKPAQVGHMGIYVGNGWFVHSSGRGVALERLAGWYESRFAWARRPLAEAGLASAG